MSYELFKEKVNSIASKVEGIAVTFSRDDNGRFSADFSDGTTIIGNSLAIKVSVKWGSGHTAIAAI